MTLNINSYGIRPVEFRLDTKRDKNEFIKAMMLKKANSINLNEFKQPSQDVKVYTYRTPKPVDGFFFTYIINNDKKYTYNEETTYSSFKGLALVDFHQGKDNCFIGDAKYEVEVSPGMRKLIVIEVSPKGYSKASST